MTVLLRDFRPADSLAVNTIALMAFEQYRELYSDWLGFVAKIGSMASLSSSGELIVAERDGEVVGAVAYLAPGAPKAEFFEPQWPIMRILVVSPPARGAGIGRSLAEECVARARRDNAKMFALHTSRIMSVALPMYERMGFRFFCATRPQFTVCPMGSTSSPCANR